MPDDTGKPAVDDKVKIEPTYVTQEALDEFGEKLVQKMGSYYGRISKEQVNKSFDEKVDPAKLQEQLSTQLFSGDISGPINKVIDAREASKKKLFAEKDAELDIEIAKHEGKPFFEETKDNIKEIAISALKNGFPPGPAAEIAFSNAKENFLINRDPDLKLSMSGPGKQIKQTKKPKLPTELKAAAERDIQDGFFKDEAEYLENLSPQMKAKYGI